MAEQYHVYMMASRQYGTLYIGVTNDLIRRAYEHRNGLIEGFTNKYGCKNLVYYEVADDINSAIAREKQLKNWRRAWKIALIEEENKGWDDLYETLA